MIENLRSVAWNGLEAGFQALRRTYPSPGMEDPKRAPVHATVLGVGAVGVHAVQAASRYGDVELWKKLAESGTPGVQVTAIDYDLAWREDVMHDILARTDILVDATQRGDTSKPVVPNEWIAWLPEHAVIVDLAVDPYTLDAEPPVVRGVEGIPQGNLDQYVFSVDDPKWDKLVPESIPSKHRRTAVTCYSWPGVHPEACMRHYGYQLEPLLYRLVEKGYDVISIEGDTYERALYRATLKAWLQDEGDKSGRKQKESG
jgi:alanine dehydrogenase